MKTCFTAVLPLLLCLSTLPKSSAQGIPLLRPLVVTLDSGTVISRPLIGIVPSAYQAIRLGREVDQQLISGQGEEIAQLRHLLAYDSVTTGHQARQLAEYRRGWESTTALLNAQEVRTAQALALPSRRPFLLDNHTWWGAGAGALGIALLKIFFIH